MANGLLLSSQLVNLSVGGRLRPVCAAAFEEWRRRAARDGWNLTITSAGDAYRTYAQQVSVFLQRYDARTSGSGPFGDVRYWQGRRYVRMRGAAAAVPGTSNHGEGRAFDVRNAGPFGGRFHDWMLETGPALGWSNNEGRMVREPWHMVHDLISRASYNDGIATGLEPSAPIDLPDIEIPVPLEDEFMFRIYVTGSPHTPSEVGKVYLCKFGPEGEHLFQHIGPEEDGVHDLVKTPKYPVDHYQKDLVRLHIIKRAAAWKVV